MLLWILTERLCNWQIFATCLLLCKLGIWVINYKHSNIFFKYSERFQSYSCKLMLRETCMNHSGGFRGISRTNTVCWKASESSRVARGREIPRAKNFTESSRVLRGMSRDVNGKSQELTNCHRVRGSETRDTTTSETTPIKSLAHFQKLGSETSY